MHCLYVFSFLFGFETKQMLCINQAVIGRCLWIGQYHAVVIIISSLFLLRLLSCAISIQNASISFAHVHIQRLTTHMYTLTASPLHAYTHTCSPMDWTYVQKQKKTELSETNTEFYRGKSFRFSIGTATEAESCVHTVTSGGLRQFIISSFHFVRCVNSIEFRVCRNT